MELLTAAQMRATEQAAIESGQVTGLELMERAGRGVVEAVFEEWPELARAPRKAVVLCGPGNNGGDGFVVARLLKEWGWEVEVYLYGEPAKLPPDAKVNHERWREMGAVEPLSAAPKYAHEAELYVDALFGTGLRRALEGEAFDWAADRTVDLDVAAKTVAVDIPSGLCADSGRELADCSETVLAGLTVSFHAFKLGHHLEWGPFKCGKTVVKDIGLKDSPRPRVGVKPPPGGAVGGCPAVSPDDVVRLVERPTSLTPKHTYGHKYTHGHALIVSGGAGRTGAARLAARGALRIGAGLVTLGVPGSAQQEVACQITALMLRRAGTQGELRTMLEDARINALCLGPGLGVGRATDLVSAALAARRATVLDADALTAFAEDPDALFGHLHEACVLTPHDGEFARLFPDLGARLRDEPSSGPA